MASHCIMGADPENMNKGVAALSNSLVKLIVSADPDARVFAFLGRRAPGYCELKIDGRPVRLEILNFRQFPLAHPRENVLAIFFMACLFRLFPVSSIRAKIARLSPRLARLNECAVIGDIRGGDSFSDIYGIFRFLAGSLPCIIVLLLGKELVLLPQTYGPYNSSISELTARWIMKRASRILCRDRNGIGTVKRMLGRHAAGKRVNFCPDVAFTLDAVKPARLEISPGLEKRSGRPVVGFNISGLLYNGGYTRNNMFDLRFDYKEFAGDLTRRFLRDTDAELLLIPHTLVPEGVESDPCACMEIARLFAPEYGDRVHVLQGNKNQSELKWIIGLCDFFIGSRMHACIAAISQGIPTAGVAYSHKFKGVFDSVGMGHMVFDARFDDAEKCIDEILLRFGNREEERQACKSGIQMAQDAVFKTFRELMGPSRTDRPAGD